MVVRVHLVVCLQNPPLSRTRTMDTLATSREAVVSSLILLVLGLATAEQRQPCTIHTAVGTQHTRHKILTASHHVQSLAVGTTIRECQVDGRSRNSKVAGAKALQHKALVMADNRLTVAHPSKADGLKVLRSSKVDGLRDLLHHRAVGQAATSRFQVDGPVVTNNKADGVRAASISRVADMEDIKGQLCRSRMAI